MMVDSNIHVHFHNLLFRKVCLFCENLVKAHLHENRNDCSEFFHPIVKGKA